MSISGQIEKLIAEFANRKPLRAGSLIISVFGDSICQQGNSVWLGNLITVLQPFGINARQIRTAVYRLVQEDWLMGRQIGRKSYYSLTDSGHRHYEQAARRIYSAGAKPWNKKWTMLITASVPVKKREALKKALNWQGFGSLSSSVYVHPAADQKSVDATLQQMDIADTVVVFEAKTAALTTREGMQNLAGQCWNLPQIEQRYQAFMQRFLPVARALDTGKQPPPLQSFLLRTLLIHEYRRILLHATDLPDELLPVNWSGRAAANLTATIYRTVQQAAVAYISSEMQTIAGPLSAPRHSYYTRFGQL